MQTRREWLQGCTSLAAFAAAGNLFGKNAEIGDDYSIVILGDTHYDKAPETIYHSDYNEKIEWLNKVQRAEFKRNGEMWADRLPRLVKAASKKQGKNTVFAIQMGDLVQGDCGNPEVHKKMMADVLDYMKGEFGGLPFLTVNGNHDIRGTEAWKAYLSYMPARLTQEMGFEIADTTFFFMRGPDLFLFIDFNKPAAKTKDIVKRAFAEHPDARYKFVIVHGPVIPSDSGSFRWFLYGHKNDTAVRHEIYELFAKNKAIVLAGHTHKTELKVCEDDRGSVSELVCNSVWTREEIKTPKVLAQDVAKYGEIFAFKDPKKVDDAKALFAEYFPMLRRYYLADSAGHFRMDVSGKGVTATYYGGDSTEPTIVFKLA